MRLTPERIARILSGRRFTVFFSGGKDSLATLLWILDNVPDISGMKVIYAEVTGNTHELCNEYVHEVVEALGLGDRFVHARREDVDFWAYMRRAGVPIPGQTRWCLTEFKRKAWLPHIHGALAVMGIRAGESAYRAKYRSLKRTWEGQFSLLPIFGWSEGQVLDYIREHGLWPNPCYARYGHSGNCMWCLYYRRDQIMRTLSDPLWGRKIISVLRDAPAKGPVSECIKNRWLSLAGQTLLEAVGP